MTGKADFSPEEWEVVLKGPPSAGMIVITAQRGGTLRESFSMAKAYSEARKQHGDSELLDEIASTKPEIDHARYHSFEDHRFTGPGRKARVHPKKTMDIGKAPMVGYAGPGWWHATQCPSAPATSSGSTASQVASARGQRVRKRQPVGGAIGDGSSPRTAIGWSGASGSGCGIDANRTCV